MTVQRDATTEIPQAELERDYRKMVLIREFEETVMRLFQQNEIEGTTHLTNGQEAIAVGVAAELRPGDTVAATYRGHGACLAMGTDPTALMAELLGRSTGICGGRGGSMNVIDLEHGIIGCFGIVGGTLPAATGAALASKVKGDGAVAVAFFGDGAVNQAYFHETLNLASVLKLPVVFVCENNLYGEWTAMAHVTGGGEIHTRAAAYGIPGLEVDGNDLWAVRETMREVLARARAGDGPTLVEALTYRHRGHSRLDTGSKYRPADEVEQWLARDPLLRVAERLDPENVARIRHEVEQEVAAALAAAKAAPFADPSAPVSATKEP